MTTLTTAEGPRQILADLARSRARRRRLIVALAVALAVPIGYASWLAGRHIFASSYLGAKGYMITWRYDRENWKQGGVSSVEVSPHVFGFVGPERSPGELKLLTWLRPIEGLDLSRLDGLRDEELAFLPQLTDLTTLNLYQNYTTPWFTRKSARPTDAFLPGVRNLRRLVDINLAGARISDAGLSNLVGLAELRMLDLSDTEVTDAGLEHLVGLKRLSYVGLRGTRVSPAGVARLKAALPEADVDHESSPTPR